MSDYKYVIVGGGMSADAAVKGIREIDTSGSIAVFSLERDLPYNRPPLSKALWKGDNLESIWRGTDSKGIEFFGECEVTSISPGNKSLRTAGGKTYGYQKLLLATGGTTRKLAFGGTDVMYFRTVEDYKRLRAVADRAEEFVVIGSGFIGSEIAAALAITGKKVTIVTPEEGICSRLLPGNLASFLVSYYREKGVTVLTGDTLTGIDRTGSRLTATLRSNKALVSDGVVAGLGIVPNEGLARSAGITVGNGIVVDSRLRTNFTDIYAAGDVANFFSPALNKRLRVEHEDGANSMGLIAGHNMAGAEEEFTTLPFFYSDLFDLGYEAVGELDSKSDIFEDWIDEFRKGVIYYMSDDRVRGVVLWNTWGKVDAARELVSSGRKVGRDSLKGMIRD